LHEAALRTDPEERSKRAFACLLLAHRAISLLRSNYTLLE
jgi:hypothetical protein